MNNLGFTSPVAMLENKPNPRGNHPGDMDIEEVPRITVESFRDINEWFSERDGSVVSRR